MEETKRLEHLIETTWIQGFASTYLPTDLGFTFSPEMLRANDVSIVDLRNALRSGHVVSTEKLDDPGAHWVVEGDDIDGRILRITLHVVSELVSVKLVDVSVVETRKDGPNDAA